MFRDICKKLFPKQALALILAAALIVTAAPQSIFGASASAGKAPRIPKYFSAYASDRDNIYLHWQWGSEGDGVLIYRSTKEKGAYKQIAKVKKGASEYKDSNVTPGKTYYYKARAYNLYKGKMIKGKYTAVKKKRAFHDNPRLEETVYLTMGRQTKEPVFQVKMKTYSYDTEFYIKDCEMEFSQMTRNGSATLCHTAKLQVIGLSLDGITYRTEGSVKVPAGKTVYIKAYNPDGLTILPEADKDWYIRCRYNGKDAVLEQNPA